MAKRIRSYAAAGAAIAVVGAVAVAPTPAQSLPDRALAVASPALQLPSTETPFVYWQSVQDKIFYNSTALTGQFWIAPAPTLQQFTVNQFNYVPLPAEGKVDEVGDAIAKNIDALITNQVKYEAKSLDLLHQTVFGIIKALPSLPIPPLVLDYAANYNSGMVMGALGLISALSLRQRATHLRGLLRGVLAGLLLLVILGTNPASDIVAHAGGFVMGLFLGTALVFLPGNRLRSQRFQSFNWLTLGVIFLWTGWCAVSRLE